MIKSNINHNDVLKIDIRIGTIIKVDDFEKAQKPAYKLLIDFGTLGIKKCSAQITNLYNKENLLNKQIIAIINLKPKQIANFMSECLVLGIENNLHEVVLLKVSSPIANGTVIN